MYNKFSLYLASSRERSCHPVLSLSQFEIIPPGGSWSTQVGTDGQRAAGSSVGLLMQVQAKREEQVQKKVEEQVPLGGRGCRYSASGKGGGAGTGEGGGVGSSGW